MILQTRLVEFPDEVKEFSKLCLAKPQITFMLSSDGSAKYVNVITPPKSGTHLLLKILQLLGVSFKTRSSSIKTAPHLIQYIQAREIPFDGPENAKKIFKSDEKYIITLRDPKDFIISYLQWIQKAMDQSQIPVEEGWSDTSMQERLDMLFLDKGDQKFNCINSVKASAANYFAAYRLYKLALPNILFIRFEDLIGPDLGGSTKERQIEVLKELCEFTGVRYTVEKVEGLMKLMVGGTLTYLDQKKVGKWKDHFSKEHIEAYKKVFSNLDVALGYKSA